MPGLNSTVTGMNGITPDAPKQGSPIAARNRMIGAVVVSVAMVVLVLSILIFYLRRRMSRGSSCRGANTKSTTPGMVAQGRNPFLDCSEVEICDPTAPVAAVQRQCNRSGRCGSRGSASSSKSWSMRFVGRGSHNSINSCSSRATTLVVVPDVARTPTPGPLTDPVALRSPASINTNADYSASWRGTNLSNIINAARGL